MTPLLEIRGLRAEIAGRKILQGLDLRVDAGEIHAIMGPNGAGKSVFLAFQYPLEIPGVATVTFLRTALNAQRRKRGEEELSSPDLLKRVREIAKKLGIDPEMLRRPLNVAVCRVSLRFFSPPEKPTLSGRRSISGSMPSFLAISRTRLSRSGDDSSSSPRLRRWALSAVRRNVTVATPGIS